MKVRFPRRPGSTVMCAVDLVPTTHPKGGDAWTVTSDGALAGVLRRWERDDVRMTITPTSGTLRKIKATKWSWYPSATEPGRVFDSRADALRWALRGDR